MIKGCPFLYQARNGTIYHVNENGVKVIRSWWSWPPNAEIVAFVDGDEENDAPAHIFYRDAPQIILASHPRGANQRWIRKSCITVLATNLWSPRELFLAGFVLGLLLFQQSINALLQDIPSPL